MKNVLIQTNRLNEEKKVDAKFSSEIGNLRLLHLAMISAVLLGASCNKNEADAVYEKKESEIKMIPKAQEEIYAKSKAELDLNCEYKVACGDGFCDAENGEKATCAWTENVGDTWKQQLLIEGACSIQVEPNCMQDCQKFFDPEKAIFCGDEECNRIENLGNCSDCK